MCVSIQPTNSLECMHKGLILCMSLTRSFAKRASCIIGHCTQFAWNLFYGSHVSGVSYSASEWFRSPAYPLDFRITGASPDHQQSQKYTWSYCCSKLQCIIPVEKAYTHLWKTPGLDNLQPDCKEDFFTFIHSGA